MQLSGPLFTLRPSPGALSSRGSWRSFGAGPAFDGTFLKSSREPFSLKGALIYSYVACSDFLYFLLVCVFVLVEL